MSVPRVSKHSNKIKAESVDHMMKRIIVMTFMFLVIFQTLCISSYSCEPTTITWQETSLDGKPVYFYKDVVVRPGQNILFKAHLTFSNGRAVAHHKVNFRFTRIDPHDGTFYEETDMTTLWLNFNSNVGDAQVGIHWKVDDKIVKPGRYRVEVQAPYQNPSLRLCTESSNIISREVVFDPGDTPEEFEVKDED